MNQQTLMPLDTEVKGYKTKKADLGRIVTEALKLGEGSFKKGKLAYDYPANPYCPKQVAALIHTVSPAEYVYFADIHHYTYNIAPISRHDEKRELNELMTTANGKETVVNARIGMGYCTLRIRVLYEMYASRFISEETYAKYRAIQIVWYKKFETLSILAVMSQVETKH